MGACPSRCDWRTNSCDYRLYQQAYPVMLGPLDIIKIRLQNQQTPIKQNILFHLKDIIKREGWRGWYRGLGATTTCYIIDRSLWFPLYQSFKRMFAQLTHSSQHNSLTHLSACVAASSICIVFTNPLWVVRTRIMSSFKDPRERFQYSSVCNGLSVMSRQEGFKSLYKGLGPSFLGISHVCVQFPLYEQFKLAFSSKAYFLDDMLAPSQELTHGQLLASSSLSKLIASVVTYPHEVIRTRLQTQTHQPAHALPHTVKYQNLLQTAKVIIHEETWMGLYKGIGTNILRTVPATAISLWVYEILVRTLS